MTAMVSKGTQGNKKVEPSYCSTISEHLAKEQACCCQTGVFKLFLGHLNYQYEARKG
jgi:hypothetical protein